MNYAALESKCRTVLTSDGFDEAVGILHSAGRCRLYPEPAREVVVQFRVQQPEIKAQARWLRDEILYFPPHRLYHAAFTCVR
jgi:hypothetical protein